MRRKNQALKLLELKRHCNSQLVTGTAQCRVQSNEIVLSQGLMTLVLQFTDSEIRVVTPTPVHLLAELIHSFLQDFQILFAPSTRQPS